MVKVTKVSDLSIGDVLLRKMLHSGEVYILQVSDIMTMPIEFRAKHGDLQFAISAISKNAMDGGGWSNSDLNNHDQEWYVLVTRAAKLLYGK